MTHDCCAEPLKKELKEIRDSQIRMEQKAESSWDPAAKQTWVNRDQIANIRGGLKLAGLLLGSSGLFVFLVWLFTRVAAALGGSP